MTDSNPIYEALFYAHDHAVTEGPDVPDWEPDEVWYQLHRFCDEVKAIEVILYDALKLGDVSMLSRAAAQLKHTTERQFGGLGSAITFTAGHMVTEGPSPAENEAAGAKGKYESLFEALITLDMVGGDVDTGRTAARMTDMMQSWVADQNDNFLYLMGAELRGMGWTEVQVAEYTETSPVPDLNVGLLESLDSELSDLFDQNSDDEDEEK